MSRFVVSRWPWGACIAVVGLLGVTLSTGCVRRAWDDCTDVDGDGYGNPADGLDGCLYSVADCDDSNPFVHPTAVEICDGFDNNCDGVLAFDEVDDDGDGFDECRDDDCDDANADVYPGAEELCDGIDNDCSGDAGDDEIDGDGDGYAPCEDDCDDSSAAVYPGAPDVCDGIADNDCNGTPDPQEADADMDGVSICDGDCDDTDPLVVGTDADGDGVSDCDGDCDDTNADVYPGAPEICDGVLDNDCDGIPGPMEVDDDLDGVTECDGDCDDTDDTLYPGATELCGDGIDQDCDGGDPLVPAGEVGFCFDGEYVGSLPHGVLPAQAGFAMYGNSDSDGLNVESGLVDTVQITVGGILELDEAFAGDLSAYTEFGDPAPVIGAVGNPTPGLLTSGDFCDPSGVWTNADFGWAANDWHVVADLKIELATQFHEAAVAVMAGTVAASCGGMMPSPAVSAVWAGGDDELRFGVAGGGEIIISGPTLDVWHTVELIKP